MNTIAKAFHPLALAAAVGRFLQEIHHPRATSLHGASVPGEKEPSLLQLYRLTRGRETISPAVGIALANRFSA
jgi:hypothetical protein